MFGLLLRPFRTLIVILVAGIIGYAAAKEQAHDACVEAGGEMQRNVCRGVQ